MSKPIMPKHPTNPVGQTRRIRSAIRAVRRHMREVRAWLLEEFDGIPVREITANAAGITVNAYDYQIDTAALARIIADMHERLLGLPMDAVAREAVEAYEEGTAQASTNLATLSDDYTREITTIMASVPWQRRAALIRSRVFEEMRGFEGTAGKELSEVLHRAIQDGRNPLDVADEIKRRFDVADSRAERIARTEITMALRRGRWDERDEAEDRLGIRTKLMHLSALSPTTRPDHAARHKHLYTSEEVRDWYGRNANGINCKCNQVEVLVDEDGNRL